MAPNPNTSFARTEVGSTALIDPSHSQSDNVRNRRERASLSLAIEKTVDELAGNSSRPRIACC
jgi:hypothetical protein